MGRIEENKQQKLTNLMETAFSLFTNQGFSHTSISDIVKDAGVAKGTFYLYFKDKYDLREKLILRKTEQLFIHALENSDYQTLKTADDRILAITDDILHQLQENPLLLRFINKNLSWSVLRSVLTMAEKDYSVFVEDILVSDHTAPADRHNLEIKIYTIIELIGASCYSVILHRDPVDLETYLPYLHRYILSIVHTA